jgi:hypothetical protein
MIRRFSRKSADNRPSSGLDEYPLTFGSGQLHVTIGWAPCTAIVSFPRLFEEKLKAVAPLGTDETHDDPKIWVQKLDDYGVNIDAYDATGFWMQYRNIPELDADGNAMGLQINYYCTS